MDVEDVLEDECGDDWDYWDVEMEGQQDMDIDDDLEHINAAITDKPVPEYPQSHIAETITSASSAKLSSDTVRVNDFKKLSVIGKGSYGKVYLVEYIATKELYAMKVLDKETLVKKNQIQHTLSEKEILVSIPLPFLSCLN